MNDTVIVALIALAGTLGGSYLGVRQANKLVNYRLDRLTAKVDAHNHLVERMVAVEASTKSAHKRLDGIDKKEG